MKSKLLILIFFMTLLSCASRKVNTDISKTVDKQTTEQSEKLDINQKEETKSAEVSTENNDKVDTETKTKVKEKYNADGSVNERTTTTSNKKSVDKSTKTFKRTISKIKTFLVKYSIVKKEIIYRTKYVKSKDSSTNNYGWIAFAAVVAYLVYLRFKN